MQTNTNNNNNNMQMEQTSQPAEQSVTKQPMKYANKHQQQQQHANGTNQPTSRTKCNQATNQVCKEIYKPRQKDVQK